MVCILSHVRFSSYDDNFIIAISRTAGRLYEAVEFIGQFYFLKSCLGQGALDVTHLARTGKSGWLQWTNAMDRSPWEANRSSDKKFTAFLEHEQ